jgi:ATP-dependent DNA helicase RecQ
LERIRRRDLPEAVAQVQARKVRQLYAMLGGATCRAQAVRRYFGESAAEPCGRCDRCLAPPKGIDASEAARKALSAVQRLGGRFGRGRLVDHLLGRTKGVSDGEAEMSTFGVGQDLSPTAWRDLIEQLLFEGLLAEHPNEGRPLIGLADREAVRQVYRGERALTVLEVSKGAAERGQARRRRPTADVSVSASSLFEALRAWRRAEAGRQRVPPYVIFHDRTLADIAEGRPADRTALAAIGGVGHAKLERYGESVLDVVAAEGDDVSTQAKTAM